MRRVIIESPFAGDRKRNVQYARLCLKDSLLRGEAPLASHLLYPQVLDEAKPQDRRLGIEAGLSWTIFADAMIFYTDLGISPGMQAALEHAQRFPTIIKIEYRSIRDWKDSAKPQ